MPTLPIPQVYLDIIVKVLFSLLVLAITLAVRRAATNVLRTQIQDPSHIHTLRMLIRNAVFFAGATVILLIWLGVGGNFAVFIGILGAGIAFAAQEVIGSFVGYLSIVSGQLFRIGDRIRMGSVVGDVLDIGLLRTMVMEMGEWVKADQYTGRIVSVANRVIFSDPVYNYTHYWSYLWDEIMLPITYDSDWQRAGEIMLEHGREYSGSIQPDAQSRLNEMMQRFPVHDTPVDPTLYLVMTDNWIELTLRYIVEARQRRTVSGELQLELLRHFQEEPNITVASATYEIVGFPPLRTAE
jgi:small-conductance mechanosensitive channel